MREGLLVVVLAVGACAASEVETAPARLAATDQPPLSPEAWLSLAGDPAVVAVDGDVALVCASRAEPGDAAPARCDAARMAVDGTRTLLGRDDLVAAARLDATRLVLTTIEGAVLVHGSDGSQVAIARHAADPRLTSARQVVAFTQYSADAPLDHTRGKLVALDLDRGARWVIADDPLASSPAVSLDGRRAVYVSARTGLASLYVVEPGRPARQLTNVGKRTIDASFVPVPGREWVWMDDHVAVYTATYGGLSRLWVIDIDTGKAAALRTGRRPRRVGAQLEAVHDGRIIVVSGSELRAVLEAAR